MDDVMENDDLLRDILSRVPPLTVVHLKRVCKRWNNLISDAAFRRHHTCVFPHPPPNILLHLFDRAIISPAKLVTLIHQDDQILPKGRSFYFDFSYIDVNTIDSYFEILDISNGLCLVKIENTLRTHRMVFVCNPLTKEYTMLPPTPQPPLPDNCRDELLRQNLVFDPCKSFNYKVVATFGIKMNYFDEVDHDKYSEYIVYVYSSESSMWQISQRYSNKSFRFSKISNGHKLNNIFTRWPQPRKSMDGGRIIGYEFDSGTFIYLPAPPQEIPPYDSYYKISNGDIYFVEAFQVENQFGYKVWEMKVSQEDYTWTFKYNFQLNRLVKILYIQNKTEQELQIFVTFGSSCHPLSDRNEIKDKGLEFVEVADFDTTSQTYRRNTFRYNPTLFPPV